MDARRLALSLWSSRDGLTRWTPDLLTWACSHPMGFDYLVEEHGRALSIALPLSYSAPPAAQDHYVIQGWLHFLNLVANVAALHRRAAFQAINCAS